MSGKDRHLIDTNILVSRNEKDFIRVTNSSFKSLSGRNEITEKQFNFKYRD